MKMGNEELESVMPDDKKKVAKMILLILAITTGIAVGVIVVKKLIDSKFGSEEEDSFDDFEDIVELQDEELVEEDAEADELDEDFEKQEDMDE